MRTHITSALAALVLACSFLMPMSAAADIYVGALVVERGPGLDQVTGGDHVGSHGMDVFQAYQSGRVHGANVHGRIFLSTNGREQTLYTGGINGALKLRIGDSHVQRATCLCVEARGQRSCTVPGRVFNFVQRGGARTAADASGVALMMR